MRARNKKKEAKTAKSLKLVLQENEKIKECMESLLHKNQTKTIIKKDNMFVYPIVPMTSVEEFKIFDNKLINLNFMEQMVIS